MSIIERKLFSFGTLVFLAYNAFSDLKSTEIGNLRVGKVSEFLKRPFVAIFCSFWGFRDDSLDFVS